MHCVNCSIFFSSFLHASFLTPATKRRLLEWKVRNDLTMYVSRGSPDLSLSHITSYKSSQDSSWDDIIKRANRLEDDGHTSKLIRALANGEKVCKGFEDREGFLVKGDMWRVISNMVMDSVESGGPHWVRGCGFEEAWEKIPERESARL